MTNYSMIYNPKDGLKKVQWEGDSYEFLKNSVDGYIELLRINDFPEGIDVWINEEGKFRDDLGISSLLMFKGDVYDYTMGNLVFTRCNDDGDTISLSKDDMRDIKKFFDGATYSLDFNSGYMLPHLHY